MSNRRWHLMVLCWTIVLSACGGGSSNSIQSPTLSTSMQISGSVGDGPVTGAEISIVDANGTNIGTTTSDATASYSFTLPAGTRLPIEIRATGGLDLVTGRALDFDLVSIMNGADQSNINVSPLTTLQHEVSRCLPSNQTAADAKRIVASDMSMGLGDIDAQTIVVDASNAAAVVKANEALGEVIRRSAALLTALNEGEVLAQIGCDLADGALDGSGAATQQVAAVVHANIASVLVETLSNSLHVDGTDATVRMNESVTTIQPSASVFTEDVPVNTEAVQVLQRSLNILRSATDNTALQEIVSLIAQTPTDELAATLTSELSNAATQSLGELPLITSQAADDELAAISNAAAAAIDAPLPAVSFSADNASISVGESVQLSWSSSNAEQCTASGGWNGDQEIEGFATIRSLTSSSSFALTCISLGGSTTAIVDVVVQSSSEGPATTTPDPRPDPAPDSPQAPTLTLNASASSIIPDGSSTLSWTSNNTNNCTASGGWSGSKTISGSETISSITSTTQFTLTCTGNAGSISRSINVSAEAPAAPILNFSANDVTVVGGDSTTLVWTATNANTCTANGGWSGSKAPSGSESTGSLSSNTSYGLTCTGPGGNTQVTVNVTVTSIDAPLVTLTTSAQTIPWDNSITLSWSTTNANSCTTSGDWQGPISTNGSQAIANLRSNQSYSLTCEGLGGSTTVTAGVNVLPPPAPSISFSATESNLTIGESTTLNWSTTETTACTASGGWAGSKPVSGSQTINNLGSTTEFGLSCEGPGGVIASSITVVATAAPAPSVSLSAADNSLSNGESTTLSWSSNNADTCVAGDGWSGTKQTSGSQNTGQLDTTTSFSLTCTGTGGDTTEIVEVTVEATQETSVSLNAAQPWIGRSGNTSLTWSAIGATECQASGDWNGTKALTGTESIGPLTEDSTYSLTCSDGSNNAVAITEVSIRQAILNWSIPTVNTDGTTLTNLAGYRVHWGTTSGQYSNSEDINEPNTTSLIIELTPGVYFFNLTALNSDGEESAYAGERSKTIE